jgi:hypothetical protein
MIGDNISGNLTCEIQIYISNASSFDSNDNIHFSIGYYIPRRYSNYNTGNSTEYYVKVTHQNNTTIPNVQIAKGGLQWMCGNNQYVLIGPIDRTSSPIVNGFEAVFGDHGLQISKNGIKKRQNGQ